jgi:Tfp pilus assembly protein FimV
MSNDATSEHTTEQPHAHPALFIVPGKDTDRGPDEPANVYSYTDPDAHPRATEVLEVVRDALEDQWNNAHHITDVYEDEVKIQHEEPPTEPYDAYGVVITFGQLPVVLDALQAEYGEEIEIWIDAVTR